jgi:hypothetical protein
MRGAGYATWSPDGKTLYFYDCPAGKYLKKVVVGGGDPVVVRNDNASRPAIAPDGSTPYYVVELRPHRVSGCRNWRRETGIA